MLRKDITDLYDNGVKGDWCFSQGDAFLTLKFGDESFTESVTLPISSVESQAAWIWNGNKEAPTLAPSIRVFGGKAGSQEQWHGYLQEGKLIEA